MATDLGKAYVQIVPSAKNISGSITKVLSGESISAGEKSGNTIGQKLISNIKKIVVGAGIGTFITQSISEGAKLEQSLGGIETMFKDSAETMKGYANDAWRTVGISANDYMEQVTSFSASLLQGLGGDTAQASTIANQAMIDMSDNANKFGTDMQSIQNAYQGFAKQNYTMLDNLKLGYGGTKTEMQRLIKDAANMKDVQEELGITVDATDMSFANIAKAISVVQKNMGVAGTTAQEAMTTVSGSLNAMKASYQNLLSSLALGENVGESLQALISTSVTYGKNVLGMVGNIARELPAVVSSLLDQVINLITSKASDMFRQGMVFINSAVSGIVASLPNLIDSASVIGEELLNSLATMFQTFTVFGSKIMSNIGEGLKNGIPQFVSNALPAILSFTDRIRESLPRFISAGMDMLLGLVRGLVSALPSLITYVPQIISNIAGLINDNIPVIFTKGWQIIKTLGEGLISAIPVVIANMGNIVRAAVDVVQAINWLNLGKGIIELIGQGITALFTSIPSILKNIGDAAVNFVKSINWVNLGQSIINYIKSGISALFSSIPNTLKNIGKSAMDAFKSINWLSLGSNIIEGIVNGIKNGATKIVDAAKDLASSAFNAAKNFLGIKSPSRLFKYLGEMTDEGLAQGIASNVGVVKDAMNSITQEMVDSYSPDLSLGYGVNGNASRSAGLGGFNQVINNYSPKALNPSEVARMTRNSTRQMVLGLRIGG